MIEKSDVEIIELFNSSDQNRTLALQYIMEKYNRRLYFSVRKIVTSHHDTDDILQNTLIKLFNSLHSFRNEASLYTFIYRIATNEAITTLRKRARERQFVSETPIDEFDKIAATEALYDGNTIERELQHAIATLPEKQRVVFSLRYYDQMPYKEMSEILETSEGALKASYHLARGKIEIHLKKSLE